MKFFVASVVILSAFVGLSLSHLEGRIVGGFPINITEAPYQVSLNLRGSHYCGGSILSEKFVLSAAHCFSRISATNMKIRAGSTHRTEGGVVVGVLEVFIHPDYDNREYDYDLAIVKLASPLEFSEEIQPIRIPAASDQSKDGDMMLVSGWGNTQSSKEDPKHLRAAEVPVVSQEVCQKAYPRHNITDNMICAGYAQGGKDSCQGDSGGPLVRISDNLLTGVVSWGKGCALPSYPGVYVKVSAFRSWIQNVTGI